jgi:cyanophycin synthetase
MTKVKRCVVDVVLPGGTAVLNAADSHVAGMAEFCKGSVLFFSRSADHEALKDHRSKGGKAVLVRDAAICLAEGEAERSLITLSEIGLPHTGHFVFQIDNLLAATGAAWAYGLSDAQIASGLKSFE